MISIRNAEVERLARFIAKRKVLSMTETLKQALQQMESEAISSSGEQHERLLVLAHEFDALPDIDERSPEEILGYDGRGAFDRGDR